MKVPVNPMYNQELGRAQVPTSAFHTVWVIQVEFPEAVSYLKKILKS